MCESLEYVYLPDNIDFFAQQAFLGCSSLKSINIPIGITGIGESAFLGCMDLKSIDIPESVRYIGSTAFKRCTSLENIYFRHHCIEYDDLDIFDDAFSEVDFDRCVLHVPSGTRWAYRNHTLFSKFINIEIE